MSASQQALLAEIAAAGGQPLDRRVEAAVRALLCRCEVRRVRAVLVYGSALWQPPSTDDVLDLYLVVDDPRAAGQGAIAAALNRVLPPNVIYMETPVEGTTVRAKCAVISGRQFDRGARRGVTPLIWGRFAQPCRLAYTRDAAARESVHESLAEAVVTFHRRLLPLMPARLTAEEFWRRALVESYARELRPEGAARAIQLWDAYGDALARRTRQALPLTGFRIGFEETDGAFDVRIGRRHRAWARATGTIARRGGKLLSLLRVMKAAFTFDGGVDYVCWKIARHSGVAVRPTPFQRRHPLIGGWPLLWRIYRQGGLR